MGRSGTLVSILLARELDFPVPEIVFQLRSRRHRRLVVESIVTLNICSKSLLL